MSSGAFPIIETPRLILDQLTIQDRASLFAIFSDPDVIRHYDVEQFTHIDEADHLISYFAAKFENDSGIRWAIRDKSNGNFLGTCGFTHWNHYDHSAVIGYELAKEYWGRGYAFESIKAIVEFIFAESFHFYVHRLEAIIVPTNTPSQKLVKRLGFALEGTLRGKCFWNNEFHDMYMFALLRQDPRPD